jgi:hypothetical protein
MAFEPAPSQIASCTCERSGERTIDAPTTGSGSVKTITPLGRTVKGACDRATAGRTSSTSVGAYSVAT